MLFIFFTFLLLLPLELVVSQTSNESSKYISTPVLGSPDVFSLLYYAKIGVGTFDATPSFRSYYLAIDTGLSITWLQCEACLNPGNGCFPQLKPPFPNSKSRTYSPLTTCNSPSHAVSRPGRCIGNMTYESGETTECELAHEQFTLETSVNKSLESVKLEFGCGFNQTGFKEIIEPGIMTGVLGLSRDDKSLQFQIDTESGKGVNFSYCFPILTKGTGPTTYLTFGNDIPSRPGFAVTPLLSIPGDDAYYVKMFDIVVNGHPLHIDPSFFDVRKNGGVILDTGSSISALIQPAYDELERHLMAIFSANPRFQRKAVNGTKLPPLCYDMQGKRHGYNHLPTIEFVLQDSRFVILPRQGFYVGKDPHHWFFCLMMRPFDSFSVIGAYQQVNHRFVYDSAHSKLLFKRENCAKHH